MPTGSDHKHVVPFKNLAGQQWYDQDHDEWVLLLAGAAGLWIDGAGERALRPGDTVLIPAHCRHLVTWTAAAEPTIWLAVHLG